MLELVVRTPAGDMLRERVAAVRVPTESGAVGLRPRVEDGLLALEPGLVLVRHEGDRFTYLGTAGGLLSCTGEAVLILTPLAVAGENVGDVVDALTQALTLPKQEMEAREALQRLERAVVGEMAHEAAQRMPQLGGAP